MRIAIVDDSARDRDQLLECLNRYFSDTKGTLETTCFTDAAAFLKDYHYSFDFIILDIDMPGLSGIEAAKVLREKDPHVTLMFVTNMPQYAIEAYSVEAMDYMLKPVSYPDFCLKMKKAERYIRRNADAPVKIQTADGPLMRQASQILYVESRQHYLYYHTEGEVLKSGASSLPRRNPFCPTTLPGPEKATWSIFPGSAALTDPMSLQAETGSLSADAAAPLSCPPIPVTQEASDAADLLF